MSHPEHNYKVDYIEFPATDIAATKRFYNAVFGWEFQDFGPDYVSFNDGRLGGGFWTESKVAKGGPLIVIYATELEPTKQKVVAAGGKITKEIFEFPGGKRFQFSDPNGNELAVWSE
jgi:hypothetical protein